MLKKNKKMISLVQIYMDLVKKKLTVFCDCITDNSLG